MNKIPFEDLNSGKTQLIATFKVLKLPDEPYIQIRFLDTWACNKNEFQDLNSEERFRYCLFGILNKFFCKILAYTSFFRRLVPVFIFPAEQSTGVVYFEFLNNSKFSIFAWREFGRKTWTKHRGIYRQGNMKNSTKVQYLTPDGTWAFWILIILNFLKENSLKTIIDY